MDDPLDEDAPLVASVAADAVKLLQDATAGSVGYPGLHGVDDAEDILGDLARLTQQLQETVAHLESYLDEQVEQHQLSPDHGSRRTPSQTIGTAQEALAEVRTAAGQMTRLLNAAEQAMLEVKPAA